MAISFRCSICNGEFPKEALRDGKCSVCRELYPDAKTAQDILMKTRNRKGVPMTDAEVESIIIRVLKEKGLLDETETK